MTSSRGMRSDTADDSPVVSTFNLAHLLGATVDEATGAALSAKAGETCVLYTKMSIRSSFHERPVGQVNHSAWVLADPSWPPLLALDRADWGNVTVQPNTIAELQVPWYRDSANTKWMELVINNMDDKGHPFHLVRVSLKSNLFPAPLTPTPLHISPSWGVGGSFLLPSFWIVN